MRPEAPIVRPPLESRRQEAWGPGPRTGSPPRKAPPSPLLHSARPQLTIATAIVFYHRFFARESYEHYERFQVATTALFLAAKVEETPRKLKDVVIETHKVQQQSAKAPVPVPEADSPELYKAKEMILICERELLRVLGFDLSVEHAYRPLLAYIKSITGSRDLAQVAWNFINDSLRTTICLTYAPRCVAAAATKLAAAYLNQRRKPEQNEFKLPDYQGKPWCSAFSTTLSTVEQIERTIQSMYDQKGHQSALSNASAAAKVCARRPLRNSSRNGRRRGRARARCHGCWGGEEQGATRARPDGLPGPTRPARTPATPLVLSHPRVPRTHTPTDAHGAGWQRLEAGSAAGPAAGQGRGGQGGAAWLGRQAGG